MTNGDIPNRENKIQNTVENLQELDISDRNLELIQEFKNYLQAQGISHAFRKGRATYLVAQGMNQAQLCKFGGWLQGSKHVSKYIRLAEADVENGLKQTYDMETKESDSERDL